MSRILSPVHYSNGGHEFLVGFTGYPGRLVMSGNSGWEVSVAAFKKFQVPKSSIIVEERDDAKQHVRDGLPPLRGSKSLN